LFAIAGFLGLALLLSRDRSYDHEESIEGLLAGVATIAVGFEFLVRPIAAATVESGEPRIAFGLQVATIGLVFPIAVGLAIGIAGVRQRILLLVLASCLAPAVTTALTGSVTDLPTLGWLVGFVLLATAAWLARREPERAAAVAPPEVGAYLRRVGGVTGACALAVTAAAVDAALRPGTEWVVVTAAAGCGVLIAARMVSAGVIADRLTQRTRERDRLAAVLDLSTTIAGTLDIDRLLPALATAAAQVVDRTRVEVTLFAADGHVDRRVCHGLTVAEQTALAGEPVDLTPATGPVEPIVRTADDPALPPAMARAHRATGKQQVLIAPLRTDGRLIGTIELWTPHDERSFTAEEVAAAAVIGREGGLAIENTRLLTETRARADERAMLLRITQAATSSLELRTVLAEIARASLGVAGAECCTILLWCPDTDEFEVGADQTIPDWPGVEEPGRRFARDYFGSDSLVMAGGRPRRFDLNSTELPESELAHMREQGTESVLVVPLITGDVCLGTLNLLSRQPGVFDADAARLGAEIAAQTALAIHNARLLEEARQRAAEPATLLHVSRAATSSLELHSVLDEIARATLGISGIECCAILLWEEAAEELEMGAEVTIPDWPGVDPPGTRYPLDPADSHRQVLRNREPVLFQEDDPNLVAADRAAMADWGARSVLAYPLWVGDECLGLLQVYSRRLRAFGPTVFRLGREVAAQTALAIHNARLLAETRRHAEEQTALLRVSRAVSSSLRLGDVLGEVARASLGIAGAQGCEIELWHPEQDEIELVAQHYAPDWIDSKTNVGTRFPLTDWPITRRVLTTRDPLIFDQTTPSLTAYEREHLFDDGTRSGFAVPIVLDDRCLGLFSLYSREPAAFTARAVALGQDLAGQAALAIERARLHAALEVRARTDGLTGVLNRGAIEEALDAELTRARRSGLPLAILLIDLDGFKHVNDRHGHLVGDRVLQEVAAILSNGVREGDHVGRYGGDEFLALLPDADETGARAVARRLQTAAEVVGIANDPEEGRVPIRLSIGHAVYPNDGSTHEELIAIADEAMYAVKHGVTVRR
jgi:diguanylate cyclase (GGDEF)-like protein